jgi:DNA-binding MarR family transcriptional regulator
LPATNALSSGPGPGVVATAVLSLCQKAVPDYSVRQMALLFAVDGEFAGHSTFDIARHLHLSKPVVQRAIARLEADGLMVRKRVKGDARLVALHLTAAGRRHVSFLNQFG